MAQAFNLVLQKRECRNNQIKPDVDLYFKHKDVRILYELVKTRQRAIKEGVQILQRAQRLLGEIWRGGGLICP